MMAPLEDTTDNALRELCFRHGADLTFTPMARLSGLVRRNKSTEKKIEILNQVPTQIQLAAHMEHELQAFLDTFEPKNGFRGINFNLGCPSPNFIKEGLGCVLIKRVSKVKRLVDMVKNKGYPCSVKLRLGANQFEKDMKVYLNLIKGVDADFFIVHARHGKQHYEAKPDYNAYPECVATGKNIIANGNIDSREKVALLKSMGVKGVMIGRSGVKNPSIFNYLKGRQFTDSSILKQEYLELEKICPAENSRYMMNVLRRLGHKIVTDDGHVRG